MSMPRDALTTVSDDALLLLYARGDGAAARELTGRLLPRVWNQARRMLGDQTEAEDVAQEAMMRLWRMAPDWEQGRAQVSTWIFRVTANLCTDRLRKRRVSALDEVDEPRDPAPGAEARLQMQARSDALQAALDSLPERQRQAVVLRHIEGLANPEIAEIMEISTEAVESLTARGKRTLAAALADRRAALGVMNDDG
ncbi:RNA polymerase sigma factor [uncultured Roseobacter sp.]|uniref:RNA polymerase sigma factor n=1 Tax=uncultured Roseobacter sp. TaxID=114847 RepID=UPI00262520BC|nr:RNA polymerase sigma factor [uncultured Roseobacter sp.]